MLKLFMLLLLTGPAPIYSLSFRNAQGQSIPFSNFRGKKILLVNTATGSGKAAQFARLEQLYQQYKDKLVIIAFPSNDFGNEAGADSLIDRLVQNRYNIHFVLASKIVVTGAKLDSVYQWLTNAGFNGRASNKVGSDFYKFLIDESGNWTGVFSDAVDPMDPKLQNAITN